MNNCAITYFKILLIIIVLSGISPAQDNLSRQFDYANNLFASGLFYDSITEYKRLMFFDREEVYNYKANINIALAYKAGGKLDEAVKFFSIAEINAKTEDELYEAKMQIVRTNILRKTHQRASELLDEIEKNFLNRDKSDEINYWRGWNFMLADDWANAAKYFGKIDYQHPLKILSDGVERDKYSVTFAKVISYILPGSGQFYTGNYLSGLMSLGWNVLLGYFTINAFVEDRVFDGLVVGNLLWLRFYRGSIENAENSARQKNIEAANKTLKYLETNFEGIKP